MQITLNLYPVPISMKGKLIIVSRPVGNEFLEESIEFLKKEKISILVSALERKEEIELGLLNEKEFCEKKGIQFFSFPMEDRSVPESISSIKNFAYRLKEKIFAGESVGIHCRASIGRASLISACILHAFGYDVDSTLKLLSESRKRTIPDTKEQEDWIRNYFHI